MNLCDYVAAIHKKNGNAPIYFLFFCFLRMKWLIMKLKTIFLVIHIKQELPYIKFFGLLHSFLSSFDRLIIHTKVGTETPLQVDIK